MRPWIPFTLAFYAVVAFAQNNKINVPAGASTLNVVAGGLTTITWSDPSSSTVTIKLQQAPITPTSGYVLASSIPASALTASFTIPATVNSHQYTIEIIDDSNPNNYNFSPYFGIQGATGTQTGLIATNTGSASSSSVSGSSANSTSGSSTSTGATSSASASSSSASTSASSNSASSSSASSASSSSSSQFTATASQTTSAPSSGGAVSLTVPGGFLAAILGAAAFL